MAEPLKALGITKAQVDKQPETREGKIALAKKAAAYWRSISPVDEGTYIASIKVKVKGDDVRVGAYDEKAHLIEFGTGDTPAFIPRVRVQNKFGGGLPRNLVSDGD